MNAVGSLLQELQRVVASLSDAPVPADPATALAEATVLLEAEQQLKVHALARIGDVDLRRLHEAEGFRSSRSWLRSVRPDGDTTDVWLSSALLEFRELDRAVRSGDCAMVSASKVVHVLHRARKHLDDGDDLIDGESAETVLPTVVRNVVTLVCRYVHGMPDDDAHLAGLVHAAELIIAEGGSELYQFERACTLLASEVAPRMLTSLLRELLVSLVPSLLEQEAAEARDRLGLDLVQRSNGTWRLGGTLDSECGERLFVALRSEASRDPRNPLDTALWASALSLDGDLGLPRARRRRVHDALNLLLERYLAAGLGGLSGKVPVQVGVMLPAPGPGALPPVADSGGLIPRSVVRRWWCDSTVTAFVMSLGGKALRVVHGQRTLSGRERRALRAETGGECAAYDCLGRADPLGEVVPHHVRGWAANGRTSLDETLGFCRQDHRALHEGRTILLRDGRRVTEAGVVSE